MFSHVRFSATSEYSCQHHLIKERAEVFPEVIDISLSINLSMGC